MSKPRLYGSPGSYTPNSRMDMRHKKKVYQRGREIAERDPEEIRNRKELKELEAMKREYQKKNHAAADR